MAIPDTHTQHTTLSIQKQLHGNDQVTSNSTQTHLPHKFPIDTIPNTSNLAKQYKFHQIKHFLSRKLIFLQNTKES